MISRDRTPTNGGGGGDEDDEEGGLKANWRELCATSGNAHALVYVNPPFAALTEWLEKIVCESEEESLVTGAHSDVLQTVHILVLLPMRTDTDYWQSLVLNRGAEVLFLNRRLNFYLDGKREESSFRFPCALVYYGPNPTAFRDWARTQGLGAVR